MNLASSLKEFCIRFVQGILFEFKVVGDINLYAIYGHYISCYYLNHLSYFSCAKLKLECNFPISNFHESYLTDVAPHNQFENINKHE